MYGIDLMDILSLPSFLLYTTTAMCSNAVGLKLKNGKECMLHYTCVTQTLL